MASRAVTAEVGSEANAPPPRAASSRRSGLLFARAPLPLLLTVPPALVVAALTLFLLWALRGAGEDYVPSIIGAGLVAGAAVLGIGYLVYRMLAAALAGLIEAQERIADEPGAEHDLVRVMPLDRDDEIGLLAGATQSVAKQVRLVLGYANDQNEMLFAAKQALEQRLFERTRETIAARDAAKASLDEAVRAADARERADARAARCEALIEQSGDAIVVADPHGRIELVNPAFEKLTGVSRSLAVGRPLDSLGWEPNAKRLIGKVLGSPAAPGEVHRALVAGGSGDERKFYADMTVSPVLHGGTRVRGFIAILRDATERVRREAEIHYLANHDALTLLPNRVSLLEHMQALIRAGRGAAVLYIDVDRFKLINDIHGQHSGNRVLVEIAERLRDQLRGDDLLARVGGDEFVAVLADANDVASSERVAHKLQAALAPPMTFAQNSLKVSASIGIALHPDHAADAFHLVRLADQAMYIAKRHGGSGIVSYAL